ncbi:unnamed protein product [Angiostrongylus costaricensis]|uniref:ANK_REP_REGION domain-containing protein n=1 Tax=Angiostrongylus costaricensis TaxID=334426 RepID=A0A0R3PQQ6_ANGCS|nr:unnamed protein product [Angiostrongylus costaricensis]
MELGSHGVKMEDLHEYAELLHQSNDEGAKRMISRVSGILEATDDAGRSTPHFAAVGGCLPILQFSISQDKSAADRPDAMGWTPLMIAASAGRLEIVRHLLSLPDVDVNHRNLNLLTPLHYACSKNHALIAHMLLEAGGDVNASDKYGATPLHRAASQGHDRVRSFLHGHFFKTLRERNLEKLLRLFVACEEGRDDAAIALVAKGADPLLENKVNGWKKCTVQLLLML